MASINHYVANDLSPRRNLAALAFIVASFGVTMSIDKLETITRGSFRWWILILFATMAPLTDLGATVRALFGRASPLLVLLLISGSWHALHGDMTAALQLGLLIWVTAWLSSGQVVLRVDDLVKVYLFYVTVGVAVTVLTDFNPYGLIPGRALEEFGVWRVSFFSSIACTGLSSLSLIMLLAHDATTLRKYQTTFAIALYFMVFSLVRSALIALPVFVFLLWWLMRGRSSPMRLFAIVSSVTIMLNLAVAFSPLLFVGLQEIPIISHLFLQGKSGLSIDEIYGQIYRPWLWAQHVKLAFSSPWFMGWGAFDFAEFMQDEEIPVGGAGSETIFTRLLASYGFVGILFLVYCVAALIRLSRRKDKWGCAAFAVVFFMMMQWGSMFHPTDANFIVYMIMLLQGTDGFVWPQPRARPQGDRRDRATRMGQNQNGPPIGLSAR
jgi:hypothetical protein